MSSNDVPQSDGALKNTVRKKILHYLGDLPLYVDLFDPIVFIHFTVNTSTHIYDDCLCLLFLDVHHKHSSLTGEMTESDQFLFLCSTYLSTLRSLWFDLGQRFGMRVTIPLDLSTWSFIPLLSHSSCPPSSYSFPSLISSMLCLSGT
jgi:hypothetical protein